MSRVFVDTSAILALLVPTDLNHRAARRIFDRLGSREAVLGTSSTVLVETYALVGNRIGLDAVELVRTELAPLLEVVWIDERLHEAGLDVLLSRRKKRLSLVDATSFVVAREWRADSVFAFDRHFREEGFEVEA